MDAERQKIGGRSYGTVGQILGLLCMGHEYARTIDHKAAAWFENLGFSVNCNKYGGIFYHISEV